MNKVIGIIIFFLILLSCKAQNSDLSAGNNLLDWGMEFTGKVTKLDSIDNYYMVYAQNENMFFKIVSKKANKIYPGIEIKVENTYRFKIVPLTDRKGVYNSNESIIPSVTNYLDVQVCRFFGKTEICTESSYELAKANNLVGVYLKEY